MIKSSLKKNGTQLGLKHSLRELRCLHDIARISGIPEKSISERLEEIVNIIPQVFERPKDYWARITCSGREFKSVNYSNTACIIAADIIIHKGKAGTLDIGYAGQYPAAGVTFLESGKILVVDAIAESLSRIIEHCKDQEALKESEERYSKAFRLSPAIIVITLLEDGRILEVNENFTRFTGYTREEALNLFAIDIGTWKSNAERANFLRKLGGRPGIRNTEAVINTKSGEKRIVLLSAEFITISGKPSVITVMQDVTEHKNLERKIIEYKELDKMKGDILATVSHELRTPLAAIKGYVTMMLDHRARIGPDEALEYLISINSSADTLIRQINNLIDTSRLDSGLLELNKEPTSLTAMIKSIVKTASVRINPHRITMVLPANLPHVNIDKKRMTQVLENLIFNAADYSPKEAEILISVTKKAGFIETSITDHGAVIPAKELKNIFNRMYKVAGRVHGGTDAIGLRLHICQRLIEAHSGAIRAESESETGTTISFTLPSMPYKKRRKKYWTK